jgi:hypothetical protein
MRALILCAGDQPLAQLLGEPLVARTVRLVRSLAPDAEIRLAVADPKDDRYKIPGARRVRARAEAAAAELDPFVLSSGLLPEADRVVVLRGDVFYTARWLEPILFDAPAAEGWHAFARLAPSKVAGPLGTGVFAFSLEPEAFPAWLAALERVESLAAAGIAYDPASAGWAMFRALAGDADIALLAGIPPRSPADQLYVTDVLDATAVIGSRLDWDRWCWEFARRPQYERARLGMVR